MDSLITVLLFFPSWLFCFRVKVRPSRHLCFTPFKETDKTTPTFPITLLPDLLNSQGPSKTNPDRDPLSKGNLLNVSLNIFVRVRGPGFLFPYIKTSVKYEDIFELLWKIFRWSPIPLNHVFLILIRDVLKCLLTPSRGTLLRTDLKSETDSSFWDDRKTCGTLL